MTLRLPTSELRMLKKMPSACSINGTFQSKFYFTVNDEKCFEYCSFNLDRWVSIDLESKETFAWYN
jgi:hypothetical protein